MDSVETPPATQPALLTVQAELQEREPIFHRPELGTSAEDLEQQMAPDFWEVGASGRCYSRHYVKDVLLRRYAAGEDDPWETSNFHCRDLGSSTYLLTYTLRQDRRLTRRVTAWRRAETGWQVLYHQGTIVTE
ncbi:DUF4440 domain-containing protein [Kineococcus sp. NBC_00420]